MNELELLLVKHFGNSMKGSGVYVKDGKLVISQSSGFNDPVLLCYLINRLYNKNYISEDFDNSIDKILNGIDPAIPKITIK